MTLHCSTFAKIENHYFINDVSTGLISLIFHNFIWMFPFRDGCETASCWNHRRLTKCKYTSRIVGIKNVKLISEFLAVISPL